MIEGDKTERLCLFKGGLVYGGKQAFFDALPQKKITVTSTNGNCDRIARENARTSYRFFITRPGNAKNRHYTSCSQEIQGYTASFTRTIQYY